MSAQPLPTVDHSAELRTCLRDLVGLLGLPALWSSNQPDVTIQLLAETLIELLSLDACAVSTTISEGKAPLAYVYVQGRALDLNLNPAWRPFLGAPGSASQDLAVSEEGTPVGTLRVARFSLGYYGGEGQITAASARPDFPRPMELILLRSAASLAASGLRTARMAYERERALRAKDEFLAMLGHELRNPLAPIVTALELIKVREGALRAQEHVVIERQVQHLKRLVDDLLDVTRITTGKIDVQQQQVEIGTVVQAALEAAQPLIDQRRHRLIKDVSPQGLPVIGDPLRLAQVFTNLLINAAKYTEPGGLITVTAKVEQDQVVLQVADNGNGIDPDLLPRVFDLFEQGRMPLDRARGGLGIGLSVVKSLVTMHGGSVRAESAGVGQGSRFTITLPLASQAVAGAASVGGEGVREPARRERILLVDDNHDAAEVLGHLLTAFGHEVYVRYSPLDALSLCETLRPTLVVVDIGLPGMDGYTLARRIRERFPDATPRIFAVTGYGQSNDRERSREAGIDVHLTKPVPIEVLIDAIARPLEQGGRTSFEA